MLKSDPRQLIEAHFATYADPSTGSIRIRDHLAFEGIPLLVFTGSVLADIRLSMAASAALLTASGLLIAFLFSVMLQVSQRAMDWADTGPTPGSETSSHAIFLLEISANAGYAALIAIQTAIIFVVTTVSGGDLLMLFSALGLALSTHLILVLLMVMNRVFALTENRLVRARTGTLHPPSEREGTSPLHTRD